MSTKFAYDYQRKSVLNSYVVKLPVQNSLAPTIPIINNLEIPIHGQRIWIRIDKPYYPITPVQRLAIVPDPLITIKFNSCADNQPSIPIDFNYPITTSFDKIYLTCHLSKPSYWDAINFPEIENCNIIIYYTDSIGENIQITKPNLIRYSMNLAATINIAPLIPGDNWFYIPYANLSYIRLIEGYFLPYQNAPGGIVVKPGDLNLQIFDDNVLQDDYVAAGGSLDDLKYPLLWQPQPKQITACQDDMYPFHPRAININVPNGATADSAYLTIKGIII